MCLGTGPRSSETITKTICISQLLGSGRHARPRMVDRPPGGVPVPAAQSADPPTSSPLAAQEGHQAHEAVRHGRCICGRRLQGRRLESGVPPLSGVLLATCMFHILLQIDVDAGSQKFMLRSLGGVSLFIPKLRYKSGGLRSGWKLVVLVFACRLLRTGSARLFCFARDFSRVTCTQFAPPERALLRTKGFCGASGDATARCVNLYADMVTAC